MVKNTNKDKTIILKIIYNEQYFSKHSLENFAAAIDMLRSIISICPDEIWYKEKKFYYMAYHTVIFLDYYLSSPVKDFTPDLPYTLGDPDHLPADAIDDVLPNAHYSKTEMLDYLSTIREKCKDLICLSSTEKLASKWIKEEEIDMHGLCPSVVTNYSLLEILFYNLRHVQHHVGQLNLLLRQKADIAAGWIAMAD